MTNHDSPNRVPADAPPRPAPSASSQPAQSVQPTALSRLTQLASQIAPPESSSSTTTFHTTQSRRRSRRTHVNASTNPTTTTLATINQLQALARSPPLDSPGYQRQKQSGKLWVRERVDKLLDHGSLVEVGSVSGRVSWAKIDEEDGTLKHIAGEKVAGFIPSNNVLGFGRVHGRKVCFTADDYTIAAGHASGAIWEKTTYIEKLSLSLKLPMLKLVDGSSGGGSVSTIKTQGYSYIPPLPSFTQVIAQLNAGIPNLGAVVGPAIGLGAARVVSCHFSVMAADIGSLFNAGPKVVAGATFEEGLSLRELGGPDVHCRNGTIDNMAVDEEDAFMQMKTVLAYLPNCGETSIPPTVECADSTTRTDESLRTAIPARRERMYAVRPIIRNIVDEGSFFEIGALWGTAVIVGLARFGGRPVGIVANNCEVHAGALDAAASQKATKHLKFCDVMNLPVVQLVDIPGYAIGTVAERTGTMRFGAGLILAYYTTTVPMFSVILRRVYGVAGGAMLDCRDPRMRVAWPSGDWGSLPLAGGIEAGHSAELKKAAREGGEANAKKLYAELEKDYLRLMNPVRTANAFGVEEIVDPALTRPIVSHWVEHVYEELLPARLMDRSSGKISPKFA